jgi:hypothetical protein
MIVDPTGVLSNVTGAIRQAAQLTGASFQYLLATAQVESNLNPNARVSTSSARGLFQFIQQTWLAMLKEQGPALGYGPYANAITRQPSGHYKVTDPQMAGPVMNLRNDPTANAVMAGAFARGNAAALSERLGRKASEGELYVAHFLGPAGAGRLIQMAESKPRTEAASVFPGAARANPRIFYNRKGDARTVGDVYRLLVGRYQVARANSTHAAVAVASAGSKAVSPPSTPNPATLAETYAVASRAPSPKQAKDAGPVFHSLFHSGGARHEAVAPLVSALWSAPVADSASPASGGSTTVKGKGGTRELFHDLPPNSRALFRGRA